jgi:arylamine N-acetyltransferase
MTTSLSLSPGISARLRGRVLRRLGLRKSPPPTLDGLRQVYNAWCRHVPFDNVRKMLALRAAAPLPGCDATDFFEGWLETGAGGTCWSGSNALYELLYSLGFHAHRATGSMHDIGFPNHGTVIVTVDSGEFLVDSSLLTYEPVPLAGSLYTYDDGVIRIEVEPDAGCHILWTRGPHQSFFLACRVFHESISHDTVLANYENSRRQSPFNQRLYALRSLSGRTVLLRGNTRYERTPGGISTRDLSPTELCDSLHADIGLSRPLIDAWSECGALAASLEPPSGPPPPPPRNVPPSQRLEIHQRHVECH